ncbi:threonine/serine exporter family protein [Peptoniphilus sp. KCTC 25270]|uniref:threonine/serine exporter family protein n=1 Tax=Peptoniphilus sp. KCTC 25270 TaxID=2897414 RepID=UPI001E2C82F6|nr:threonine/serine exporter family protein [Peptoniphilus sp. KCTC 25270]MCD1147031.1 threonine/serine exporter family protein [Peptoniphilus sp. KCTC 25270]
MDIKMILFTFAMAVLSTIGYSLPVNAPKKSIFPSALCGAIGYLVYIMGLDLGWSYLLSSFLSAFVIGALGELFSRIYLMPATIFILPGLITLVPGGGMYYSMLYLIQDNTPLFLNEAINTFFIAMSLSIGIVASTIFSRSLKLFRKRSKKRNMNPMQ